MVVTEMNVHMVAAVGGCLYCLTMLVVPSPAGRLRTETVDIIEGTSELGLGTWPVVGNLSIVYLPFTLPHNISDDEQDCLSISLLISLSLIIFLMMNRTKRNQLVYLPSPGNISDDHDCLKGTSLFISLSLVIYLMMTMTV